MALTLKQQRFIEEYAVDLNATQAAIRAGYSQATAAVQGSCLLRNIKVEAEIDRRRAKLIEKMAVDLEDGGWLRTAAATRFCSEL
jgi:phage terminase small subunit